MRVKVLNVRTWPARRTRWGNHDAANGKSDGPSGTDPAELECTESLNLAAYGDQDPLQPAAQHQKNHATQKGKKVHQVDET